MNVKLLMESLVVGALLYVLGGIALGMVMTVWFAPDMPEAYESSDIRDAYTSQQENPPPSRVVFGGPINPWLEGLKALLVCAAYYGIRYGIASWRRARRQRIA
ncbi:hypothetical protein ACFFSY_16585 [Paenibacillus aurantiacus]|uniref:Cobalt transporter n=1 Tax=Paenibacillus aurantiacus TaxID=1936118 RepID=A0ABV5KQP4_9BACL